MDYRPLSEEIIDNINSKFHENRANILRQNVCTKNYLTSVCISHQQVQKTRRVFSHKIEAEGRPITDQKSSGRCWIFAGLNVIRVSFMKKYDLPEFEFSQAHVYFWDKVEKCYFFLNSIVEMARRKEPVDGRAMSALLSNPASDDFGQWDMLANIINKYGLMPKMNFPETYNSENSHKLNVILRRKLREFSIILRKMVEDGKSKAEIRAKIDEQMEIAYRIIGICLGIPPKTFIWEYEETSREYHSIGPITPKEFYETYVKPVFNVDDRVSLVNDPRPTSQYNQLYTVDCLGNMIGGRKVMRNNQPIELLAELCAESIKNGEPVWISCDVFRPVSCIGLDYDSVFGFDSSASMTKAERLIYRESSFVNHAMVLTAVSLDENYKPVKWRVENSSGPYSGVEGYFMMTNDWFKEFVFEVAIDKSIVPKEIMDVFEKDPVILPIWDVSELG